MSTNEMGPGEGRFRYGLRGYDPAQVDPALRAAERAARSDSVSVRAAAAQELRSTEFLQVLRGYDRLAVDKYTDLLIRDQLLADPDQPAVDAGVEAAAFGRSARGYDTAQVDALLHQAGTALVSNDAAQLARAQAAVQAADLDVRWFHGYDRSQVDQHLAELDRRLTSVRYGYPES